MLASSTLDLLVAVSPLVHNLWDVVGAKGDSPRLSLETLNMGRSLGRRWERLWGVKACPQGHLGVSQRTQPPGLDKEDTDPGRGRQEVAGWSSGWMCTGPTGPSATFLSARGVQL